MEPVIFFLCLVILFTLLFDDLWIGLALVSLIFLLASPLNSKAGEPPGNQFGLNLGTYHFNRGEGYREINPGLYVIHTRENGEKWIGGVYANSIGKTSLHLGRVWAWGQVAGKPVDWQVSLVTGYPASPVLPIVAPSVKLTPGLRATLLLPVEKHGGGVHLSWEF